MNIGIHHITPSDKINRLLWQWILGQVETDHVTEWIESEVDHGRLHPNTIPGAVRKSALEAYGDRVTRQDPCVWCNTPTSRWDTGNPDCGCF